MPTRLLIPIFHVCALVLTSCAQSPIDESLALDDALAGDDELAPSEDDDSSEARGEEAEVEVDDDDATRADDARDGADTRADEDDDASPAQSEAARQDAGLRDAASMRDGAALPGSGESAVVRRDASTSTAPPARDAGSGTARDAGMTSPASGGEGCRSSAECRNSCFPVGIAPCCRANRTCGCSWAPGAYCL